MNRTKSDNETFADWARGYVTDSLYNWGKQPNPIRTFCRQQTGYYKQASAALQRRISRYPADNAAVLDEVYIRLEAPLKAVMRVEYKDCPDGTMEEKAFLCGVSRKTYRKRVGLVIDAAQDELLLVAETA